MSSSTPTTLAFLLAACGSDGPEFRLEVRIAPIPDAISAVSIDQTDQPIETDGVVRFVLLDRTYANYAIARESPVIVIDFLEGDSVQAHATTAPGACAINCILPVCPSEDDLELEQFDVRYGNFMPGEFGCLVCTGGGKSQIVCN